MDSEKRRILEMVGEGKISQEDALRLLDALEDERVDRALRTPWPACGKIQAALPGSPRPDPGLRSQR